MKFKLEISVTINGEVLGTVIASEKDLNTIQETAIREQFLACIAEITTILHGEVLN